eukprot:TRINITY_DN2446_c0_g2_i1.p2 TRINITY_DN2446_c0_g2~~TRINITY_DN2446_c0_g2_i1.p2  ORF type:complete len:340 (+),score=57.24 TRINITY_DN2446_c0_g2_i1:152-1021(+)
MKVDPTEMRVLITEYANNTVAKREKAAEYLFEDFGVAGMYIASRGLMNLFTNGRTEGISLDIGYDITETVAGYYGHALSYSATSSDIAGKDVSQHLATILHQRGYDINDSCHPDLFNDIKKQLGYVALDFEADLNHASRAALNKSYELPGGQVIEVANERFRAPEILFSPSRIGRMEGGVHELVNYSMRKCHFSIWPALKRGIVVAGGSTLFPGFVARLQEELEAKLATQFDTGKKAARIKIAQADDRKYSAWVGGSIMASLQTFQKMWFLKENYEEHGVSALHRKLLF